MTPEQLNELAGIVCEQLNEQPGGQAAPGVKHHMLAQGAAAVMQLTQEAQQIEEAGGLRRLDGGRRTLGGVYFQLAKARGWLTNTQKARRFVAEWERKKGVG